MEFAQKVQIAVQHKLFAFKLDFGSTKFGKEDFVSDRNRHWDQSAVLKEESIKTRLYKAILTSTR